MSKTSRPVAAAKYTCPCCKTAVNAPSLDCDACHKWFHPACVNIPVKNLDLIKHSEGLKFFCKKCKPDVEEVLKNLKKFTDVAKYVAGMEANYEARFKKLEEAARVEVVPPNHVDSTAVAAEDLQVMREDMEKQLKAQDSVLKEKLAYYMKARGREILKLDCDIDTEQQYERRDSVIVHNVREMGPNEDLYQFATQLCAATGGRISAFEVSVVHRLGPFTRNRSRSIIIKFTRRVIKSSLMRNKHKLRHNPGWERVYIEENLTPWHGKFVHKLKQVKDVTKVITTDGKIAFNTGGKKYFVNSGSDFVSLMDSNILLLYEGFNCVMLVLVNNVVVINRSVTFVYFS